MDPLIFKNKLMMLSHILNQELKDLDQITIPIHAGSTVTRKTISPNITGEDGYDFQRAALDPIRAPSPKVTLQTTNYQLPSPDSQKSAVSEDSKIKSFDEVFHTQTVASLKQPPASFEAKKHAFIDDSVLPAPPAAVSLSTMQRSRSTSTLKRGKICSYCGCEETPMWRNGPPAYKVLCNKCGVKWRRGKILNGEQQHHLFKRVQAENDTKNDAALALMSLVS